MGIIRGMHQSLPAKVKYFIPKQKQALINDWPYLFNVKQKMDIIKFTYLEANHRVIPRNGFISIKLTLRGTTCNYFSWIVKWLICHIIFFKKNLFYPQTQLPCREKKKMEIELVYMKVLPTIYKNIIDFSSTPQVFVLWEKVMRKALGNIWLFSSSVVLWLSRNIYLILICNFLKKQNTLCDIWNLW